MGCNETYYAKVEEYHGSQALCVFASYDAKSVVQKYVYHLLDRLQLELSAHVVFVTTSEQLHADDKEKLSKMGVSVVHRKNIGYDFKSYFVGFSQFEDHIYQFQNVYHCNDSVFGPFASIEGIRDRMNRSGFDVWGMTDSWQIDYHIQSYFICFRDQAIGSLRDFWNQYEFKCDYDSVIKNGEVGMSQYMMKQGFCLGAAFPVERYIAPYLTKVENAVDNAHTCMRAMAKPRWYSITHRAMTVNPSFALWKPFARSGYPFLKKKLLLEWCHLGSHSGDWLNIVSDDYEYAKSVAQASVHRDRPALSGRLKPRREYFFLHPFKFCKYIKNWSEFMRSLVSD